MDLWKILEVVLGSGFAIAVLGAGIKWLRDKRDYHRQARNLFEDAETAYRRALKAKDQRKYSLVLPNNEVNLWPISEKPYELRNRARELLKHAREIGPDRKTEANILCLQAQMLYDEEIYDMCIKKLNIALKKNGRLRTGYELRGQAYEATGHKKQALRDYQLCSNMDPYDEEIQSRVEDLKKKTGSLEEPTIWQKWLSMIGRTRLCMSLA